MRFAMPPASDFYSHLFRDKETKKVHVVVTTKETFKRKANSVALCATNISRDMAWRRPPMGTPDAMGITCWKCLRSHTALNDLLTEH